MKVYSIICILVVAAIEVSLGAPTSRELETTTITPFEDRNVEQLADYVLQSTIHKYDTKMSIIVSRLKRFMEALDFLSAEAANDDDTLKIYTEVRQSVQDTLKALHEDTQTCGLYPVAMLTLGHITKFVAEANDSPLWNYWTLSNIDEKPFFVSVGYHIPNLDEYKEAQKFFNANQHLALEAQAKAKHFIDSHCQKYKEFTGDLTITN